MIITSSTRGLTRVTSCLINYIIEFLPGKCKVNLFFKIWTPEVKYVMLSIRYYEVGFYDNIKVIIVVSNIH